MSLCATKLIFLKLEIKMYLMRKAVRCQEDSMELSINISETADITEELIKDLLHINVISVNCWKKVTSVVQMLSIYAI